MKKIIFGLIIGLCISGIAYGYRISKPQRVTDFNERGLVIVNENFERLWDVTNGRVNFNMVVDNPDSVVKGEAGDLLLLNSTGTYYLEMCTGGKVWRGVVLTNVP